MRWTLAVNLCLFLVLPTSAQSPPKSSTRVEGARRVLAAIVQAGQENASLPPSQRKDGDELTALYFRSAASSASQLSKGQAGAAFLLALGVGLDDTTLVRSNPLVAGLWRQVESDDQRQTRLKVLGKPTMRQRHDWTQHFVVSCALTEAIGAALAESAGLLKEQLDARPGGSGFSFADLSADLAGIALATRVKNGELSLEELARRFEVTAYLPDPKGSREGLSAEQFARDFGSLEDERFKKELAGIRKRVEDLYAK